MPATLLTVPHIQQRDNSDCLAACAAMILAFVGIQVPYPRLVRILNIQSYGAPARNLYHLSELGVEVNYHTGSLSIVEEALERGRPAITLVRTEFLPYWTYSTDHAVVVIGIDENNVYLHDPAFVQHPMRVTKLEFELAWMEFDYRYCIMTVRSTNG